MYKINILNFYFDRARSFNQWQRALYPKFIIYSWGWVHVTFESAPTTSWDFTWEYRDSIQKRAIFWPRLSGLPHLPGVPHLHKKQFLKKLNVLSLFFIPSRYPTEMNIFIPIPPG